MKNHLIVVVDDDSDFRSLIVDILKAQQFQVADFPTARSALEALKHGPIAEARNEGTPIILLSDQLMPGRMNGIDFLKIVKQEFPDIPFLLVTAVGGRRIIDEANAIGAQGVIHKPFSIHEFIHKVQELCPV